MNDTVTTPAPKPQGGMAASLVGVGIGWLAGKAAALGVHVDAGTQASVSLGVYALVHRFLGRWGI